MVKVLKINYVDKKNLDLTKNLFLRRHISDSSIKWFKGSRERGIR